MKKLILLAMFPILFAVKGLSCVEASAVKECPYRKVSFSEVKDGEIYLVVTEYVKGVRDAEGITPETVVVIKQVNN